MSCLYGHSRNCSANLYLPCSYWTDRRWNQPQLLQCWPLTRCLRQCNNTLHCIYWCTDKRPPDKKSTGLKTTKNANPGIKTTRTKDHPDKRPPSSKVCSKFVVYLRPTDMFAAEYRSDNPSGLNCRVIKSQHQTERLCLSRHLVRPTALITTQHHNLVRCSLSINQTRYFGTLCRVVLTESEHQTEQVRLSRHFI